MARVTVEDCLARIPNRFALTILASRRARALLEGKGRALVECDNKSAVTALREISDDKVRYIEDVDTVLVDFIAEQRTRLQASSGDGSYIDAAAFGMDGEDGDLTEDIEELTADVEKLADDDDDDDGDAAAGSADVDADADAGAEGTADDLETLGDDSDDSDDGDDGDDGDDADDADGERVSCSLRSAGRCFAFLVISAALACVAKTPPPQWSPPDPPSVARPLPAGSTVLGASASADPSDCSPACATDRRADERADIPQDPGRE